ncbi:MAG: SDR family NAD(P)-dependent oxidoreductase [Gemmobacter sp.]
MGSDWTGQTAVVTGAARGLGLVLSRRLAEAGAAVLMVDLDEAATEAAAAALRPCAGETHALAADLCDPAQVAAVADAVRDRLGGRLDLLVNNAGGWRHAASRDITLADWDWTFRTNALTAFLTTRSLMDFMIAQKGGRIVNVTSTDAHRPKPTMPHYAAAKAALVSLTKSFAEELAPHQVLVNAVSPGAIGTEIARSQAWFAERIKAIPVGRAAEPEDIADVILFLGSRQNRFVVGQTVMANGGMLMA